MSKIGFAKFGLKPNNEIVEIYFNNQTIEVKQYLPVEEKLELITNVLELSHDQNNFSNPVKVQVYTALGIIEKYTNINFTEKQKENPTKLYDLLVGNGLIHEVVSAIPQEEYDVLIKSIYDTDEAFYKYRNSVLGILEQVVTDYKGLELDANNLYGVLADPENMEFLKSVLAKMG